MSEFTRVRRLALSAAGALALTAGACLAADAPTKTRAAQLQAVVDCRKLADPTERLACYDQAAAGLDAAERAGDVVVVDRSQVREARQAAFGFNVKMPAFLTRGEPEDVIASIDAVIASARQDGAGKWIVRLEDGAVWRQVDSGWVAREPRSGSKVTIRRTPMGGYLMNIDGQTAIRVHREN